MTTSGLTRSRTDRQVAGVCAGLAKHFGMDVDTVRMLTLALAIFTAGTAIPVAYLIAWMVLPEEGTQRRGYEQLQSTFSTPSPTLQPTQQPGATQRGQQAAWPTAQPATPSWQQPPTANPDDLR